MKTEEEKIGDEVRKQGGQGPATMSELVFDPTTGEFHTSSPGEAIDDEEMIVTDMTKEGYA